MIKYCPGHQGRLAGSQVPGRKGGGGDFTAPTSQKSEMMHLDYEANFMTNNVLLNSNPTLIFGIKIYM